MDDGRGQLGDLAARRERPGGCFRRPEYILDYILLTGASMTFLEPSPPPLRRAVRGPYHSAGVV
jgi:hypothetical protein